MLPTLSKGVDEPENVVRKTYHQNSKTLQIDSAFGSRVSWMQKGHRKFRIVMQCLGTHEETLIQYDPGLRAGVLSNCWILIGAACRDCNCFSIAIGTLVQVGSLRLSWSVTSQLGIVSLFLPKHEQSLLMPRVWEEIRLTLLQSHCLLLYDSEQYEKPFSAGLIWEYQYFVPLYSTIASFPLEVGYLQLPARGWNFHKAR